MSRSIKISDAGYKKIWQIARHEGWELMATIDKAINNYFKIKLPRTKVSKD